jgi:hypothetical protein
MLREQRFMHKPATYVLWCINGTATSSFAANSPDNKSTSLRNFASNSNGSNDNLNGNSSPQDILNSTSATTEWKRNHYNKISQKFQSNSQEQTNFHESAGGWTAPKPLQIDSYEDVQPMWKNMESRVTKRRSYTLQEKGGVSGRRNVRRSDEDVWLEAGVYDADDKSEDDAKK